MKAIHYQVGSVWRRWDPHIHAPGTILYDEFGTDVTAWNEFLRRIEEAVPLIVTLGITDYYSLDNYEAAVARKKQGRLEDVALIFPNIAMRLAIGTGKGAPINIHCLVSPDDPDHADETKRFLREFSFEAYGGPYRCEKVDLMKLGRAYGNSKGELILDDE